MRASAARAANCSNCAARATSQSCRVMQRKLHTQCASQHDTTVQRCNVLSGPKRRPQQPFPRVAGPAADGGQETPGIGDRRFRVVPQNLLARSNLRLTPLISSPLDICSPGRPDIKPIFCRSTDRLAIFLISLVLLYRYSFCCIGQNREPFKGSSAVLKVHFF